MKKEILIILSIFHLLFTTVFSQQSIKQNQFKIGVFGATSCKTHNVNGCNVPFETPLDNGFKTSLLNVLSEDGFNIFQTYAPNEWFSENYMKSYLMLSQANNFQVELGAGHYFKPSLDATGNYLGYGTNVYDNCNNSIGVCQYPYSQNYFRANINDFINNIYHNSPYKDIIWGYHMCEEASFYHFQHVANNCQGNEYTNPNYFKYLEIPPVNVNRAISYYKNALSLYGITNQKMVVMEANHFKNINSNTNDGEGVFNPQQFIQLLNRNDNRDVFFEGSYTQFPSDYWINQVYSGMYSNNTHYLGPFKSIDYAKNYTSEIHKVINIEGTSEGGNYLAHYHSNLTIPNANWLWFQAYTSIIHGVKGIWFWDINYSWNSGETDNWNNTSIANRYDRTYFPTNYKNFTAYLAQELRLLTNKNILSSDPITIVATKTDNADSNCIVPPALSYIPSSLPSEKRTENYGLRYTIRTNGTETYMIITNPLNVAISVTLNFSNTSNLQIQNSTGVSVLFDNNQFPVTSSSYKLNRNSNVDLSNGTVGNQYNISFLTNKQLPISFGPLDVKILKFVSSPPNFNNGWNLAWSNFGSGNINNHNVKVGDIFYLGDFDGDQTEELLCVGYSAGGTADWITLLKYVNENWELYWSNYGSSSVGNGMYNFRNNFIIGDYDGDGKDELLGNDINGSTTLYKFENGNWQLIWTDNASATHVIHPYKDKIYSGDFNGDGKAEILGCDLPNGWTTTFKWNGSNFIWDWSDYGNNHAIRQYRNNLLPGDYDGDGKTELLGFSTWATLFHFDNSNWQWGWSTNGANNFNGWQYPTLITDRILSGNIDSDTKDELFFLQTHPAATWATTMDLKNDQSNWNWNWSANPQYSITFVDDWSLVSNSGSNTRYYLVKANANQPKYLLTMRMFCDNFLINMYRNNNLSTNKMSLTNSDLIIDSLINANDISVFPNPSTGKIEVLSSLQDIESVEILDPSGQTIYDINYILKQRIEIDLSTFPIGMYFIKIRDVHNAVIIRKLILSK